MSSCCGASGKVCLQNVQFLEGILVKLYDSQLSCFLIIENMETLVRNGWENVVLAMLTAGIFWIRNVLSGLQTVLFCSKQNANRFQISNQFYAIWTNCLRKQNHKRYFLFYGIPILITANLSSHISWNLFPLTSNHCLIFIYQNRINWISIFLFSYSDLWTVVIKIVQTMTLLIQ